MGSQVLAGSVVRRRRAAAAAAALVLGGAVFMASGSRAAASVTIGQLAPVNSPAFCTTSTDRFQTVVGSGASYVVPGTGTITSWSHNAGSNVGATLEMKIFRKVADPATYLVVGSDGPRALTPSVLNIFPTSIPVKAGDVLGTNGASPASSACFDQPSPGAVYLFRDGNLADGEPGAFAQGSNTRLNVAAEFNPSNSFTLGKTTRSKKKGTATLRVVVPNPGELTASGKGVKSAAAGAVISKTVTAAGEVKLTIRAKGKKKRKLKRKGKVKLGVNVTYTPTGGDTSTQATKVKLKKKRKKKS